MKPFFKGIRISAVGPACSFKQAILTVTTKKCYRQKKEKKNLHTRPSRHGQTRRRRGKVGRHASFFQHSSSDDRDTFPTFSACCQDNSHRTSECVYGRGGAGGGVVGRWAQNRGRVGRKIPDAPLRATRRRVRLVCVNIM